MREQQGQCSTEARTFCDATPWRRRVADTDEIVRPVLGAQSRVEVMKVKAGATIAPYTHTLPAEVITEYKKAALFDYLASKLKATIAAMKQQLVVILIMT